MERGKPITKVVLDAGPIIHLDELGCLELLSDFQDILVPDTVREEVNQHRPLALEKSGLKIISCSHEYPSDEPRYTLCRVLSLDAGEIEALAVMEKHPTAVFFTDDGAARLAAKQMGFNVHGTIGILIRAIRRGMMEPRQVVSILEEIPLKSTLHIKPSLLEKIIRKVKNEFGC